MHYSYVTFFLLCSSIGSSGGGSATLTSKAILEHLHKEFASIDDGVKVNLAYGSLFE